jgi:hypothetical protein
MSIILVNFSNKCDQLQVRDGSTQNIPHRLANKTMRKSNPVDSTIGLRTNFIQLGKKPSFELYVRQSSLSLVDFPSHYHLFVRPKRKYQPSQPLFFLRNLGLEPMADILEIARMSHLGQI